MRYISRSEGEVRARGGGGGGGGGVGGVGGGGGGLAERNFGFDFRFGGVFNFPSSVGAI